MSVHFPYEEQASFSSLDAPHWWEFFFRMYLAYVEKPLKLLVALSGFLNLTVFGGELWSEDFFPPLCP